MRRSCATLAALSLLMIGRSPARSPDGPIAARAVTIYRDDFGVPHIYADREEDGFYALGYAEAEDELEYVLTLIVLARGEAAAALGPAHLESDFSSRMWRHTVESKAGFGKMSPDLQRNYRGYVAGLERYMREHPDQVPAWAPKLEVWDPVVVSRWLLWNAYQVADGLQDCRAGGIKLAAGIESGAMNRGALASNEWVLAPWRTADHAAIVLSDPHGDIDGSFVYEFRMHAGAFESAGFAVGAMPILTHNRHVSWGMTTGAPDVSDCYEVAVDPRDSLRYQYDGHPERMTTEAVTIRPRGGRPVTRIIQYTRHNGVMSPVVARAGGKAYVVSTTYMHDAGMFDEEVYRMNLARDVGELREAMKRLGMFPQNVMAGDDQGGSFYVRAGKAPRRPAGFDWRKPVPGNDSRSAWLGIHPLDDLVQVSNPPTGYMQNDNIAPDVMFEGSPLTQDRYSTDLFNDRPDRINSRARRTVEALSQAYQFTVQDAIDLALDEKWMHTDQWQDLLRRAAARDPGRVAVKPADERRMIQRIAGFDGMARVTSVAALDYWFWRDALSLQPDDVLARFAVDTLVPRAPLSSAEVRTILDAVGEAAATMRHELGDVDRPLGDAFVIRRGSHTYPIGGVAIVMRDIGRCQGLAAYDQLCTHTLRAMTARPPDSTGKRVVFIGSRLLRLVIFTKPLQSFTLHNFGQSAHPGVAPLCRSGQAFE